MESNESFAVLPKLQTNINDLYGNQIEEPSVSPSKKEPIIPNSDDSEYWTTELQN